MRELEESLLEELRQLPPDDQITFHSWADRWEEWVRQFGLDPITFDFEAALAGVIALDNVLQEAFGPYSDHGQQVATTLVLMHRRQQEERT